MKNDKHLFRIVRALRKHLNILHISDRLKQPSLTHPSWVQTPTQSERFIRAGKTEKGQHTHTNRQQPLLQYMLQTCNVIMRKDSFTSHSIGIKHRTRFSFTCKTKNLVYLIQCSNCGLQYVGETKNPLHIRMNGHRSDINT